MQAQSTLETEASVQQIEEQFPENIPVPDDFLKLRDYWAKVHENLRIVTQKLIDREENLNKIVRQKFVEERNEIIAQLGEAYHYNPVDSLQDGKQVFNRVKQQYTHDPIWLKLSDTKNKLESKIEIQKAVQMQAVNYQQTSQKLKELIDKSSAGLQLKYLKDLNPNVRVRHQNVIVSLNKKIKENIILPTSNKKPITIDQFKKENKQDNCSIDSYITSVMEFQQGKYGYISNKEKLAKKLERELNVCDYLQQNSWREANKHTQEQKSKKERHRQKLYQMLSEHKSKQSFQGSSVTASAFYQKKRFSQASVSTSRDYGYRTFLTENKKQQFHQTQSQAHILIQNNQFSDEINFPLGSLGSAQNLEESSITSMKKNSIFEKSKYGSHWPSIMVQSFRESQQNKYVQECQSIISQTNNHQSQDKLERLSNSPRGSADSVKDGLKPISKFQQYKKQVKMAVPKTAAEMGVTQLVSERISKVKQLELQQIAKSVNKQIQPHDPYLQSKYEFFQQGAKENQHQCKQRDSISRSKSELVAEFLSKRGLHIQNTVQMSPIRTGSDLSQFMQSLKRQSIPKKARISDVLKQTSESIIKR